MGWLMAAWGRGSRRIWPLAAVIVASTLVPASAWGSSYGAVAWGQGSSGELGNGSTVRSNLPVAVKGLSTVSALAGGEQHSLALLADGTVRAWGRNNLGQLGNGTKDTDVPVAVRK
ncbi:MAG: hypothetical protein QOG40_762, partial [Solirubrobacteraceae bacterium]|nr:hypothetical protein [Solirubrobacteraceae bacterium]